MDIKTLSFSNDTLTVQPLVAALVARNAAHFAGALQPLLRSGLRLEVNLSRVDRFDGAGVGALLSCQRAMQRQGCTLVLTQVQPHLERELQACGLQALLATPSDSPFSNHWVH
jgi:anti-anti-sigma factor